jgi:hypothetical protein
MLDDIFWVAALPISFLLAAPLPLQFQQPLSGCFTPSVSPPAIFFEVVSMVFGALLLGAMVNLPIYEKYRDWRDDPIRLHRLSKRNSSD